MLIAYLPQAAAVWTVCCSDDAEADSPVFAHQSRWQQHILMKYGQTVCLVDATYNTTVYEMPLFMLCVMTNVGYVVVATFLLPDKQAASIKTALRLVKKWSPAWQPTYIMSDFCEAQISAFADVFPGQLEYIIVL